MPFPDLLHVLASHRQSVPQQCVAWAHLLSGQMVSEQRWRRSRRLCVRSTRRLACLNPAVVPDAIKLTVANVLNDAKGEEANDGAGGPRIGGCIPG